MKSAGRLGLVAAVGLLVGVLTQIGQGSLPDGVSQAANSISPWLLVAFLVGSRMPDRRWATAAGFGALVGALVGYYGMIELRYGFEASTGSLVFWGLGALVGGPVFGVAGWSWRFDDGWRRAGAVGLLAAAAIAEGLDLVRILPDAAVGLVFVGAGLLVLLVFGGTVADRSRAYVAILPALALGAVGYVAFLWLDTLRANL
jgi:hypothetical protein